MAFTRTENGGGGNPDIWLHDVARRTSTRFTSHPAADVAPVWSPDGSRIVFASDRDGPRNLYQKVSSGAGNEETLSQSAEPKTPTDWSSDGRFLLFTNTDPKMGADIWVLPMIGARKPEPYLKNGVQRKRGPVFPGPPIRGLSIGFVRQNRDLCATLPHALGGKFDTAPRID